MKGKKMKLKGDFVTNSSSTSFIAWGISKEDFEFKRDYEKALVILHNESNPTEPILSTDDIGIYELAGLICEDNNLEFHHDYYGDCVQIGISPFGMEDDETVNQLKERVVKQFKGKGIIITSEEVVPQTYCEREG
jgi:hypothetical protein